MIGFSMPNTRSSDRLSVWMVMSRPLQNEVVVNAGTVSRTVPRLIFSDPLRLQSLHQKIDETAYTRREMPRVRIKQNERPRTTAVRAEQVLERAVRKVLLDHEPIRLKQARAVTRQRHAGEHVARRSIVSARDDLDGLAVANEL